MSGNVNTLPDSVGRAAVRRLRAMILEREEGAFLGSEQSLMNELAVSRSTFRQAARLVEHEQLLTIRRGMGGGFYTRRPDPDMVAHAAAIYLQVREASLLDVMSVIQLLAIEATRLAASCTDETKRAGLRAYIERAQAVVDVPQSTRDFHRDEVAFVETICDMAGNVAIDLFLKSAFGFGHAASAKSIFEGREDSMRSRRLGRIRVAEAILFGDGEVAALIAKREMGDPVAALSLMPSQGKMV